MSPPLVKFTKRASADPNEVERMWADHPEANIGVHAGPGTVIVDADTYKNPACLDGLEIPETTTVRSASGGRHFYLLGSSSTRTDVRPGLDLKGRGGYAVGPGSVFDGRSYRWEIPPWEIPPQPAPPAVLKLVRDRPRFQAIDKRPIPKGRRDNTLTQIAGWFIAQDVRGEPLRIAPHTRSTETDASHQWRTNKWTRSPRARATGRNHRCGWWTRSASPRIRDSTARADTSSRPSPLEPITTATSAGSPSEGHPQGEMDMTDDEDRPRSIPRRQIKRLCRTNQRP